MEQFAVVLQEYRKWLQSFRWYALLSTYELHLLLGGVGILIFRDFLYNILPYGAYDTLDFIFHKIPIFVIAINAFFLGIWITLSSTKNLKFLPYGMWGYGFYMLFPFTSFSLGQLVTAAIYGVLGYFVFKFTASHHAAN